MVTNLEFNTQLLFKCECKTNTFIQGLREFTTHKVNRGCTYLKKCKGKKKQSKRDT